MSLNKYQYIINIAKKYIFDKNNEKNKHCSILFNSKFKIIDINNNFLNIHAETNVLKTKIKNIKNILIIRIDNEGNLLYSKPCYHCIQKIKKKNIKNIIYSINSFQLQKEKIIELENNHISKGNKI